MAQDWHLKDIACGTIGYKDSSVVISPVGANKWTKVTNSANDLFDESGTGYHTSLYADGMIIYKNGWYALDFRQALSTTNNRVIKISVGINDTSTVRGCIQGTSPGTGDIMPFTSFGKFQISDAPDTVFTYFKNIDYDTDITVYCGALRVIRIRP